MKIGNVEINGKAVLAPMAGVADRAFRELCVNYGAAYVVSEMISSKGVSMGDRKSKDLMFLSDKSRTSLLVNKYINNKYDGAPEIRAKFCKLCV